MTKRELPQPSGAKADSSEVARLWINESGEFNCILRDAFSDASDWGMYADQGVAGFYPVRDAIAASFESEITNVIDRGWTEKLEFQ